MPPKKEIKKPKSVNPIQRGGIEGGFRSVNDKAWFEQVFASRGVMIERPLGACPETSQTPYHFTVIRTYTGWEAALKFSCEVNVSLAREFVASLIRTGTHQYAAFVRGVPILFHPQTVSAITNVPLVENFECPYLLNAANVPSPTEVASFLYGVHTVWSGEKFLLRDRLAPQFKPLHLVLVNSMFPTNAKSKFGIWLARIFYAIVSGKRVDLCRCWIEYVVANMQEKAKNKFVMCGVLLTRMCYGAGVQKGPNDEMKKPLGAVDQSSFRRSASQKRRLEGEAANEGEGDEDVEEEEGDEENLEMPPTDVGQSSGSQRRTRPRFGDPQQYMLEQLLKGQEAMMERFNQLELKAEKRHSNMKIRMRKMNASIDKLSGEFYDFMQEYREDREVEEEEGDEDEEPADFQETDDGDSNDQV